MTTTRILDHNPRDPYGLKGSILDTTDAMQAMRAADLDWKVTTVTALADLAPTPTPIPDTYSTVRQDPNGKQTPLSAVGKTYHPLQNETVFRLLQDVVDSSDAVFEAAGHTHGSRRTFVKMKLPQGISIGNLDPMETSIVAFNSHDGSGQLTLVPTAIRLFCTNQFPALKRSEVKFTARHTTGSLDVGLDAIRASLDLMFTSLHTVEEIGNQLVDQPLPLPAFDRLMTAIEPKANRALPESLQLKSAIRRSDLMRAHFLQSPNLENVRGTAWAGLQAVIETMDWDAMGDKAERMVVRSRSSEAVKSRALDILTMPLPARRELIGA